MVRKIVNYLTFFLIIFMMIFSINLYHFKPGFILVTSAQEVLETENIGEKAQTEDSQEVPSIENSGEIEELAEEVETEEELDLSLKAEFITYEKVDGEDLIIAQDGVQLNYQDIEVKTDYLKINLSTNLFYASGEVYFLQGDSETDCEELTYNWKTKKVILQRLKGKITGKGIEGYLYYQGEEMENFPETVKITGGNFTTCDLEEPHYHIVATEMIIYPKDKIIARNISWYEGNTKIFTLPYFLVFLDRKTQMPILPKIGQNGSDGWFVKANFNYYIDEKSYGTFYLDWLEEKGIGIGAEHTFELGEENNQPGEAAVYFYMIKKKSTGKFTILGEMDYEQDFNNDITTKISLDYTGAKSSGSNPLNNTLKSQFNINKSDEKYNLKVTGKYTFKGQELNDLDVDGKITLKHNYSISDKINSALTLVYTDDNPSDEESDLELRPKWNLGFNGQGYTLNLLTEKRIDLDGDSFTGDSTSKIIDRLPEFIFKKNSATFGDTGIVYSMEGSVGRFYEGSTEEENTRGEYIVNLKKSFDLGEYLTLTPSGIFRQDVYLTGEARYLVGGKIDLKAAYNSDITGSISYSYNKSEGPTPFNFDYIEPLTHSISGKLTFKPNDKVKLDLSTKYNFVTDSFGNLVAKLEYEPKTDWKMNFNTSYDLNDMEWNKQIKSQLDLQLSEDWRVKYKGTVDLEDFKLSNSIVGITRDFHCREFTLNYRQSNKSFWVEFFIKAFPTEKITIGG